MTSTNGRVFTHHSSGSAIVSNGTIRVAKMMPKITFWPRNCSRASAKAAIELTINPKPTVQTVMITELIMNWARGTRSAAPM